jgi:uncharacterized protein (TIGR02996 family)
MRTFVFQDAKSHKFWNIDLQGKSFTVNFGKVGSKGQTQMKDFADDAKTQKAHDKLVAEKLAKGYVETTPKQAPSAPTPRAPSSTAMQQALEKALIENPDDLANHMAYADYLAEQGDPRGEFIQVQLALEDPKRSAMERTELKKREAELLKKHARQWLGDLGRFLVGDWSGPDKPYDYQFVRGWLDLVRVLPFPHAVVSALARSPEVRLLRRLEVVYDMRYHPFDFDQFTAGPMAALTGDEKSRATYETYEELRVMPPLLESDYLSNLRVFKLGFSHNDERLGYSTMTQPFDDCNAQQVIDLLKKCPRLDELYLNTDMPGIENLFILPTLGNLRVLQYYFATTSYGHDSAVGPFPLNLLADNTSLKQLTTLRLHAGRDTTVPLDEMDAVLRSRNLPSLTHLQVQLTTFGDEGCQRIIQSEALRRLKVLDIAYGNMTDDGARLLAACPDLKHLERLDVSRNALTDAGVAALNATGVAVVAADQHGAGEQDYLYEVDFE